MCISINRNIAWAPFNNLVLPTGILAPPQTLPYLFKYLYIFTSYTIDLYVCYYATVKYCCSL